MQIFASAPTMSEIFDSLPYYDNDLEQFPHLRELIDKELAKEQKKPPAALHPNVPPPVELFSVRLS